MLYKNLTFMEYGVKPIWVFGNDLKEGVTDAMKEEVKELLKALGLPIVQTKGKADAQCALLNKKGIVLGVSSENLDCLAYGADVVLRNFKNESKLVVKIEREKILAKLGLTQEQFVDLCVLCGTNHTQPIKGIAGAKALNYIKEYGSLKATINALKNIKTGSDEALKYKIADEYLYEKSIKEFTNPETTSISLLQVIIIG